MNTVIRQGDDGSKRADGPDPLANLVMLHERDYDGWLDCGVMERLPLDLLGPYEAKAMEMHEPSRWS